MPPQREAGLGGRSNSTGVPRRGNIATRVVRNPFQMQSILGAGGARCEAAKPLLQPPASPAVWQPPAGWAQAHLGDGGCWDLRGTSPGVTGTTPLSGAQQQGYNRRGRWKSRSAWLARQLGNVGAGLPPARKPQGRDRDRATTSRSDTQQREVSFWASGSWAGCWKQMLLLCAVTLTGIPQQEAEKHRWQQSDSAHSSKIYTLH